MYRGFDLNIDITNDTWYRAGLEQYTNTKASIKKSLDSYLSPTGSIDGTALQNNWFRQVDADVFISHSHQDKTMSITLAGWLSLHFGLTSFVDSCIWEHADQLLRNIDNTYCLNAGGATYDYELRNNSTSHVHMMLSAALTMMIDKTECLFFLRTPNSITTSDAVKNGTTNSPWLYSEIITAQYIRKQPLSNYRREMTKSFTEIRNLSESAVPIEYKVYTGHLTPLNATELDAWRNTYSPVSLHTKYPLDILYKTIKPTTKLL